MDKITGNFLTQPNKDFPLDCETLDYLQGLSELVAVIGNIGGDKIVLKGCAVNAEGTRRAEGYVFLRTREHPEGEVLRWEGGTTTGGMYVKQESIGVNANNTDYPKAYTRRTLAPGIGEESYRWEDFTGIKSITELMAENRELRAELAGVRPAPLGVVQMWAGTAVPEGYVLCDGQALRQSDYPALYKALGTAFNEAMSAGGTPYTTDEGYFRVPDLRGRFMVGRHDSDNDYRTSGQTGGKKRVVLTTAEMPAHRHLHKDYILIPNGSGECRTGKWTVEDEEREAGYDNITGNPKRCQTGGDNRNCIQWIKHPGEETGNGESHENRPPYYVLAYIMRVR